MSKEINSIEDLSFVTYIYALVDPRNETIRYIGKSNTPETRYFRHIKNATTGEMYHTPVWIRSLLAVGLKPKLQIIEVCSVAVWKARESFWIDFYRSAGNDLTNLKDGGDGDNIDPTSKLRMSLAKRGKPNIFWRGRKHSNETRARQRDSAKARWQRMNDEERAAYLAKLAKDRLPPLRGHAQTAETRMKISAALRKRIRRRGYKINLSEEQRAKLSRSKLGHVVTQETRTKISREKLRRRRERDSVYQPALF